MPTVPLSSLPLGARLRFPGEPGVYFVDDLDHGDGAVQIRDAGRHDMLAGIQTVRAETPVEPLGLIVRRHGKP